MATGLAYSFAWAPLVRHQSAWVTPGDLWATYRGAQWVLWGGFGDVYGSQTHLVTFPGILLVMAPVAAIGSLSSLYGGFPIAVAHPSAWLVVGPFTLLLAAVPLCGLDALAEARAIDLRTRRLLCLLEAAALWVMVAYWGHPEDAVALGLVAYGLSAGYRSSWRAAGWLLGAAVVMQPLSLLALPAILAWAPVTQRLGALIRTVIPAGAILAILLTADLPDTWHALTKQPNYPTVNHPTPWVWLSPSVGRDAVAAGPGRVLAVALAVAIGVWTARHRRAGRPIDIVWAVGLAFVGRCLFEPVMVPFYVTPAVTVAILLAAQHGRMRLVISGVLGVALTVAMHMRAGPLQFWIMMVGLLAAVMVPGRWGLFAAAKRHVDYRGILGHSERAVARSNMARMVDASQPC